MTTVFVCEDSLDGILTGVYEAWDSRLGHGNVKLQTEGMDTMELFCEYQTVRTDLEKAEKVLRTVKRRMGEKAREAVCYASACPDFGKADAIYRLIVLGLSLPDGRQAVNRLQDPAVLLVEKLRYKAWHEAERMLGFLRFEELAGGVLYARMNPPYAILPLIAPHFADRLLQENWIIQDTGRSQAAVHRAGGSWFLTDADLPDLRKIAGYAETEKEFQTLWRAFCKSIAIEERRNPRCQQTLLPLRFRPDMTEFQPDSGQPGAFWQDSRFDSLRKS